MIWLIPAVPAAVFVIYCLYEFWPLSPEATYDRRRRILLDDMAKRKLSPEQRKEEMSFRYAKVRLREKATAAVKANPARCTEIISELAAAEAKTLALIDRRLARKFMDTVKSAHLNDILYADALKAVEKHHKPVHVAAARQRVSKIDIAAVTTLK
jgi:hypothetical protein